nr:helix-turn-helix transcriptional regulator [uncultured Dongia sp.]
MSLLERESSLESLNAWLAQIATGPVAGTGCVVLVAGEAGIGKTALLQQFTHQQHLAKRVLWGGCEALFTPHPLAPLYDMARQAGGEFTQHISTAETREHVFNATMDHLSRGPMPTILVFEDVHWADEATLDLIKYLGRRLTRLGVMLIATYRDDEVGVRHPLHAVIGDLPSATVHRLQPAPLSAAAVATLAEAAGRSAARLHEITGGNPFFVTEALAVPETPESAVPATVRDAVIARLARLSEPARAVVNVVALVPGKTERWLLDKTVPKAGAALQECLSVGMVALPDGALAFRHELARRAVEEHLPIPQRQDLHARILRSLLRQIGTDVPTTRLVHHADQAGDSEAVLRYAPLAAERAAALSAHREAAAHYETAFRHAASWADACRADLLESLSYEYYLIEHVPEAIEAREAALKLWRAAGDRLKIGDSLRWLSRLSWFNGVKDAAERYATDAIETLEQLAPGRELAYAYSNRAQLHMLTNEPGPTLHWGRKAIDLATALNDTEILSHAYNNVGTAKATAMDLKGYDDLEHSLKLALDAGLQEHAGRAYTNLATTAIRLHDFDCAIRYLNDGIAYCENHELVAWIRYMTAARSVVFLAQGHWDRAADEAQAVITNPCVAPISKIQALMVLGLVRARRGDPDSDAPLNEAMDLAVPTGEMQRIGPIVAARAEVAWFKGAINDMADEIRAAYDQAQKQSDPWMQGELAFWRWRCDGALERVGCIADPFAHQIAGNWAEAASLWESIGAPYEMALALADSSNEADLRKALKIFEELGAAPMAGILRRKLRAGGIRGITRGAQERTRQNPHGLTARELGVLEELTQGRRNADIARRLFVSEKTVDHHVSSILAKLGVRSRGEAAAAAHRLGLAEIAEGPRVARK